LPSRSGSVSRRKVRRVACEGLGAEHGYGRVAGRPGTVKLERRVSRSSLPAAADACGADRCGILSVIRSETQLSD
jgi:hypothetical protein